MAVSARAQWKGYLRFGEVTAPVALYTATSTSDRIAFHTVNRETGNRVRREFVDSVSGKPVEKEDQVKGYEIGDERYVVLEPEEVASAVPESDKTLRVQAFITCDDVDKVYFDKPYYLTPDKMGTDAFALLREGMRKKKVAAIAQTVLFRRMRTVLLRPHDKGLIATTLNFDYEVRSAKEAFKEIPDIKIEGEMLDLAKHIIGMKTGKFAGWLGRSGMATRSGRRSPTSKIYERADPEMLPLIAKLVEQQQRPWPGRPREETSSISCRR